MCGTNRDRLQVQINIRASYINISHNFGILREEIGLFCVDSFERARRYAYRHGCAPDSNVYGRCI